MMYRSYALGHGQLPRAGRFVIGAGVLGGTSRSSWAVLARLGRCVDSRYPPPFFAGCALLFRILA